MPHISRFLTSGVDIIIICRSLQIYFCHYAATILDKTVSFLCPVCLKIVPARIFSDDGKVFMEKR